MLASASLPRASLIASAFLLVGAQADPARMRAVAADDQSTITVTEAGKSVLVYNFHAVPVPEGVGGKYAVARSNYVHPLFGLDGEVLTMDYSPDHPHHRGIYWAWPEVTYNGTKYDLHALQGVFARPVKIARTSDGADAAEFTVENEWRWEDKEPIVREFATIRVSRTTDEQRFVDFDLRFEALKPGVTVARRGQSQYGGLNVRLSARKEQKIVKHNDTAGAFPLRSWAYLSGIAPEGRGIATILILQPWNNAAYPGDWVDYPNLNWLQPTFPTKGTAFALTPGQPLHLRYRICVGRGVPDEETAATLWDAYNQLKEGRMAQLAGYRFGDDRTLIAAIEKHILSSQGEERLRLEDDLVQLIDMPEATSDVRKWALRQVAVLGTGKSVPVLSRLLTDADLWPMACYALRAIPATEAGKALREALGGLHADLLPAVLGAIGERRDTDAVAVVTELTGHDDPSVRGAAIDVLARLGTPQAAAILDRLVLDAYPVPGILNARLRCADLLRQDGETADARRVFNAIWSSSARSAHRGAALVGLAACGTPDLLPTVLDTLGHDDARLRSAAVKALPLLRSAESAAALTQKLGDSAPGLQLMILPVLAEWEATGARPKVATLLDSEDVAIRLAALKALVRLGGDGHTGRIAEIATERGEIGKAARDGLVQLRGAKVADRLHELAKSAPVAVRKVAIDAMAARNDPGTVDALLALAGGDDTDSAARALAGLKRIADAASLPRLLQLYVAIPAALRDAAGGAVLGVVLRSETPTGHAPAILRAVEGGPEDVQAHAMGILAQIGGDAALTAVRKAVGSESAVIRSAAVRALASWPDASALGHQLTVLDGATDTRDRVLLLRGIVRLVPLSDRSEQDKAAVLTALAAQKLSVQEQKLLISALGGMKTAAVLPVLVRYLDAPETAAEAALAIRQAVCPAGDQPGLVGADAKKALQQATPHLTDEKQRQEAKSYLSEIASGNIARGKPASSNKPPENGHPPAHAVDGVVSTSSYWGCAEGPPARLQVDLQDTLKVAAVHLYPYWGGRRYYQYTIELSEDGETWQEVVDQRKDTQPSTAQGVRFEVKPTPARYVRVTMLKNSANPGLHIVELKVFEEVTEE